MEGAGLTPDGAGRSSGQGYNDSRKSPPQWRAYQIPA
jgi:hypothetical protein